MSESKVFSLIFNEDRGKHRGQRRQDKGRNTLRTTRDDTVISPSIERLENKADFAPQRRNLKVPREEVGRKALLYKFGEVNMRLAAQDEYRDETFDRLDVDDLIISSTRERDHLQNNLYPHTFNPNGEHIESFRRMRSLAISGRLSLPGSMAQHSLSTVEKVPNVVDDLRKEVERIIADPNWEEEADHVHSKETGSEKDAIEVNEEDLSNNTRREESEDINNESDLLHGGGGEDVNIKTGRDDRVGTDEQNDVPVTGAWCSLPAWKFW